MLPPLEELLSTCCCDAARWQVGCIATTGTATQTEGAQMVEELSKHRRCSVGSTCELEASLRRIRHVGPSFDATSSPTPPKFSRIVTVTIGTDNYDYTCSEGLVTTYSRMSRLLKGIQSSLVTVRIKGSDGTRPLGGAIASIVDNGLEILGQQYSFLYTSNSQVRECTGVFVSDAAAVPQSILDLRGQLLQGGAFRAMSRMGLLASTERSHVTIRPTDFAEYPDVLGEGLCLLTDGNGLIDRDYALDKGIVAPHQHAVQFRFQGRKGVLLAVPGLASGAVPGIHHNIAFRPSQRKFELPTNARETELVSELSVLRGSEFMPASSNREAIQLLSANEDEHGTVNTRLAQLHHENIWALFRVLETAESFIDAAKTRTTLNSVFDMSAILSKFEGEMMLDPWWQQCLGVLWKHLSFKAMYKFNFPIEDGAHLMGVPDPYGVLEEGEVFVAISKSKDEGTSSTVISERDVVVYRNPCLHPGDVRRLKAVAPQRLVDAGFTNLIVFPCKVGVTSIPAACSGGDLDGDDFTVIWDADLVNINQVAPEDYTAMEGFFEDTCAHTTQGAAFEAASNGAVGRISNMHTALCSSQVDGALADLCKSLAKSQSVAVDSPKTGQIPLIDRRVLKLIKRHGYPHYLNNVSPNKCFSATLLGSLFDYAEGFAFTGRLSVGSDTDGATSNSPQLTLEQRSTLDYWSAKVSLAVESAGFGSPQEFFMGLSAEGKYINRGDRLRLETLQQELLDEFKAAFADARHSDWFAAACVFDPAGDLGVRGLFWRLAEPSQTRSKVLDNLTSQIKSKMRDLGGLSCAVYAVVMDSQLQRSGSDPGERLVTLVKETIEKSVASVPSGSTHLEVLVLRRTVNSLLNRRDLDGDFRMALVRLQLALVFSRTLGSPSPTDAKLKWRVPKPNVPRVVSLVGNESTYDLVEFVPDRNYRRIVVSSNKGPTVPTCREIAIMSNSLHVLSEGVAPRGHLRRLQVMFGTQLFGGDKGIFRKPKGNRIADIRAYVQNRFVDQNAYTEMVPLPKIVPFGRLTVPEEETYPIPNAAKTKKHINDVRPVLYQNDLDGGELDNLRAALTAEAFERVPGTSQRFQLSFWDERHELSWVDDARTQLDLAVYQEETHRTSSLVIIGGPGTPPDARLKLTCRIAGPATRPVEPQLLKDAILDGIEGADCGEVDGEVDDEDGRPVFFDRESECYQRHFGLEGSLSSITITAVIETAKQFKPVKGKFKSSGTERNFLLDVHCFDEGVPPMDHPQCREVILKSIDWVSRLQSQLPKQTVPPPVQNAPAVLLQQTTNNTHQTNQRKKNPTHHRSTARRAPQI